jgi:pyruvate formate lyase activating enzyme
MTGKVIYDITSGFSDFNGRFAYTLWFAGCNLCCPHCYNKELIGAQGRYSLEQAQQYIEKQPVGMLDECGVVFSGGEPSVDLESFQRAIETFKGRHLAIHTNGLQLPKENLFEEVVLSLKTPIDGIPEDYQERVFKALEFYKDAARREIRIVEVPGLEWEIEKLNKVFAPHAAGWVWAQVPPFKKFKEVKR